MDSKESTPQKSINSSGLIPPIEEESGNLDILLTDEAPAKYNEFYSYKALFESPKIDDLRLNQENIEHKMSLFDKFFKIQDYFLEIKVGGKNMRIEMDIEGVSNTRLQFKETEFLYPVGSYYAKMHRVIEKKSKKIFTCKRVTLKLLDPATYQVFIGAVKEALFLSSVSGSDENLLRLRGYYFVKRQSLDFWNLQIELLMLYDDHDLCLLDLMRARKLQEIPWPEQQAELMLDNFTEALGTLEATHGIKIIYPNSLNIVYSKSKDRFFICNLQNILLAREYAKVVEIEEHSICDLPPNNYFTSVFPKLERLYIDESIKRYSDITPGYSLSIVSMQIIEIACMKDGLRTSQHLRNLLSAKLSKHVSPDKLMNNEVLKSLRLSLGTKLRQSLAGSRVNHGLISRFPDDYKEELNVKLVSEVKVINAWKKILRDLKPEEKFKKDLFQAEFLLISGNYGKAITYARTAIEEFTKVGKLDVLDWIELIIFLVNCFQQVKLKNEAKTYAISVIKYINRAVEVKQLERTLGDMLIFALEAIFGDAQEIYERAQVSEIPNTLLASLRYFLVTTAGYMPEIEIDSEGNQLIYLRDANFLLARYLLQGNPASSSYYLGCLEKKLQDSSIDIDPRKELAYLNNLAVGHFVLDNKMEALENIRKIDEFLNKSEARSTRIKFVEVLNTMAVFEVIKGSLGGLTVAIQHLEKALEIIRKVSRTTHKSESVVMNNLAICYSLSGMNAQARDTIYKMYSSLKHERQKKPIYMVNLAILYSRSGELEMAEKIINKIKLRISQQHDFKFDNQICRKIYLASSLNYLRQGKYKEAISDLDEYSNYIKGEAEDPIEHAKFRRLKAIVYIKQGDINKAKINLEF